MRNGGRLHVTAMACVAALTVLMPAAASMLPPDPAGDNRNSGADERREIKPTVAQASRDDASKVFLERADRLSFSRREGVSDEDQYQVLEGDVVMRKEGMWMYCDSAYFYELTNSLEAMGHVRMEQGDTLFVYGHYLDYDGQTEQAVLEGSTGTPVRMIDRQAQLLTPTFYYDMASGVGFYLTGGELTDDKNVLTSREGEYNTHTKLATFTRDVVLTSPGDDGDTLRLYTDSLLYHTDTHMAEIVSMTRIVGRDGTIYSTSGTYDTDNGLADLYERSTVVTNRGTRLTGDTLMFDRSTGIGEAYGNVVITDSVRQSSLSGDYGFYNDPSDSAFVTGRALAKEYSRGDTLYMHGDTINAYMLEDSTRVTNAFHRVRFYRSDMSGLCDSMSITEVDSLMHMYRHPVIWSGERQVYGNLIELHINDSVPDWALLPRMGFMTNHIGEDCYDQLTGSWMKVYFNDSTVERMDVEGNVQMILFPMESDSTYNKYVYAETSTMECLFRGNFVTSVRMRPETTGHVTPLYLAKKSAMQLQCFRWYGEIRPLSPESVFERPEQMLRLMQTEEFPFKESAAQTAARDRSRRRTVAVDPDESAPPPPDAADALPTDTVDAPPTDAVDAPPVRRKHAESK